MKIKTMKITVSQKAMDVHEVRKIVAPLRKTGKTLVTTNGCFDLLHAGHINYLHDAAMEGDLLVVGINSDESVSRLKGPSRPIQKEHDRVLLVAALKVVDYAFIFPEDDPCAFLEILQPDIHVKGGDYRPEGLPETEVVEKHGGRVVIVPFAHGYSTSLLIDRVRSK
ncbi:MAG: D-glycero-beta-D-manno-heptose 1-phosphate adenylyltransferase [Chitinispirillaceae bacterium]|nr:D-glycero-beta-D-manno-heptose 1-phosphate adenylyltransferase [Chitinispirillaceae bacterium]